MSKKRVVVGLGILGVLGLLGVLGVLGREKEPVSPEGSLLSKVEIEGESVENKLYTDEAGFSFEYPGDWVVEDVTDAAGEEYYARVLIGEDRGDRGKELVRVEIRDTEYKKVEEWVKEGEEVELVGAVKLDEIGASQYKSGDKLYTVAIDQGALYLIEGKEESESVYNTIVESFKFAIEEEGEGEEGGGGVEGGGGAVIYEVEEVIE